MEEMGKTISSADYWEQRVDAYLSQLDGPYHRHRLEVIWRLMGDTAKTAKSVLDFGCGDGVTLAPFVAAGARATGIDLDPAMIEAASERLALPSEQLLVGGVERLEAVADASVDLLLALNVAAYFSVQEDEAFYHHTARVLRPGGVMVITHSNRLFDMYSLNGFTARFVGEQLCSEPASEQVATLLTHADRFKVGTGADFGIRENPLAYRHKLARFGLIEEQQEFANLHALPPPLMDAAGFIDIDQRDYPSTLDWPADERWKLNFVCSMFGSRAIRSP